MQARFIRRCESELESSNLSPRVRLDLKNQLMAARGTLTSLEATAKRQADSCEPFPTSTKLDLNDPWFHIKFDMQYREVGRAQEIVANPEATPKMKAAAFRFLAVYITTDQNESKTLSSWEVSSYLGCTPKQLADLTSKGRLVRRRSYCWMYSVETVAAQLIRLANEPDVVA